MHKMSTKFRFDGKNGFIRVYLEMISLAKSREQRLLFLECLHLPVYAAQHGVSPQKGPTGLINLRERKRGINRLQKRERERERKKEEREKGEKIKEGKEQNWAP